LRLVERKVPFIFHSERMTHELGEWPDVPVITKPADGSQVVEVVASLLGAVPVAETKALTPRMPTVFPSSSRRSGSSSCGRANRVKLGCQPRTRCWASRADPAMRCLQAARTCTGRPPSRPPCRLHDGQMRRQRLSGARTRHLGARDFDKDQRNSPACSLLCSARTIARRGYQ
jgi:hypothetical protein